MEYFLKFYPPTPLAFNSVQNRQLFFGSPSELNDDFEQRFDLYFEGDSRDWRALIKFLMWQPPAVTPDEESINKLVEFLPVDKRVHPDVVVECLQNIRTPLANRIKDEILVINRFLFQNTYTCSFSKTASSAAQWGNYTDSGKGFALVVQCSNREIEVKAITDLFFSCEEWSGLSSNSCSKVKLIDVDYDLPPLTINVFHDMGYYLLDDHESEPDVELPDFNGSARRKGSTWSYEQEVRAMFPQISSRENHPLPASTRSLEIPENNVKGVIFGPRTNDSTMINLIAGMSVSRQEKDLWWFQATSTPGSFDYAIKPLYKFSSIVDQIPEALNLSFHFDPNHAEAKKFAQELSN